MNNLGSITPPGNSNQKSQQANNPFARALAETEKGTYSGKNEKSNQDANPFSETLAKTGGQIPENSDPKELKKQQDQLAKEKKKSELRKKLHDRVNPVDQAEIFSANKERTQKDLNEVRKELKKLAAEITKFYKEVDIQTTQDVTEQGISEGLGLRSYFQKLKAFIILLTQKVKSARTWMNQHQSRAKRMKSRKIKGGVAIGKGSQESKAVFEMMHHERSSTYSGG
jgi:hypothetical protein